MWAGKKAKKKLEEKWPRILRKGLKEAVSAG